MPDKDLEGDGPSLELPSFGFGRRTRRDRGAASDPDVPPAPDPAPDVAPGAEPEVPAHPVPGHAPDGEPTPRPEIDPVVPSPPGRPTPPEIDPLIPSAPPRRDPAPEIDPVIPSRPEWQPGTEPTPEPGTAPTPEPDPAPDADPDPTVPEVDPTARPELGEHATRTRPDERATAPPARFSARELRFPSLAPLPAVLLVGALVGLAAVVLTWGALRMCDVATGTASCGGGPGLLLLVAIMIALTYLGGWLLRGFGIDDAGSTSFLAVSLLAVVAMLLLVDSLDEWSGVLTVPVVTVAAYALSWRATAALVDAGADQR